MLERPDGAGSGFAGRAAAWTRAATTAPVAISSSRLAARSAALIGPISAAGTPSTVMIRRSPARARRTTRLAWFLSSRIAILSMIATVAHGLRSLQTVRTASSRLLTMARTRLILNLMVQYSALDRTFAAVADPTRRQILDRLAQGPRSISALARPTGMSLTGLKKHVRVLEDAGLVTTIKKGRVRECRLGPDRLDAAADWIELYRRRWEGRLNGLEATVDRRQRRAP
jgi:DNA-binding transcriptional ArsR family regulator